MSLQYVIDGYNIINHPEFVRKYKQPLSPQTALSIFIKTKRLTGSTKNRVFIVFDGYPPSDFSSSDSSDSGIIFSRKISADEKIKRIVEESAQRKNIVVVSDDKEIKLIVKSLGAQWLGVEDFIGPKKRTKSAQGKDLLKQELNYSQMDAINKELSKLWLNETNE